MARRRTPSIVAVRHESQAQAAPFRAVLLRGTTAPRARQRSSSAQPGSAGPSSTRHPNPGPAAGIKPG
jgi:hypothetical protein